MARMPAVLIAVLVALLVPAAASAETLTLGSPLTATPNVQPGCEAMPQIVDTQGNVGAVASGTADCTWRLAGSQTNPADPRGSTMPGTGRVFAVSVRSGPSPSPLRFVIFRQIGTVCCFFVRESNQVQPRPNAISTFAVDLPVERNVDALGIPGYDLIGVSGVAGAGSLPLANLGSNNIFAPSDVTAGFWYPRLGAIPNDSGGGRQEGAIHNVEVLLRFAWCGNVGTGKQGVTLGPDDGCAIPVPNGGFACTRACTALPISVTAPGPGTLAATDARAGGRASAAGRKATALIAPAKATARKAEKLKLTIKLTSAGKKALAKARSGKLKVSVKLTFTPSGGGAARTKTTTVSLRS
jgi:hypothetical protein